MTEIKVKQVVTYGGHSMAASGSVNLTLKSKYSELPKSIQQLQMLNNDVSIKAKLPGRKPMKLGVFRINKIVVDGDGESVLKFNGLSDYIEMDNLNLLPLSTEENKEFAVMMEAEVEIEGEVEEDVED